MQQGNTELEFSTQQRYQREHGQVLLTGVQALVRALQTRAGLDAQAGLNTGGFVSGYRGSPLGGLDKELWAQADALQAAGIHFQPGVNEDLAATAVWGSQQVGLHAGNTVDGVYGLWYGKAPGLDRSCDAIRHANAWGTSARGGVVLVVGDDPAAKSSSVASQSEFALADLQVPVLAPSSVQDVLDYTLLAWEMSRFSGLWVGIKAIADHMDSAATVDVGKHRYVPATDVADVHIRREDTPQQQEVRLLQEKLPRAVQFARQARINTWPTRDQRTQTTNQQRARLGIVCAGKAYSDVREAFAQLGAFTVDEIAAMGVELLKLGLTWPLDQQLVQDFAAGVEAIFVVEEKRAFVEPQIKQALYGHSQIPVFGKLDPSGQPLLAETGILECMDIALFIDAYLSLGQTARFTQLQRTAQLNAEIEAHAKTERTPLFCAGCPHNTSTRVPEGSRATAGIGCHYMAQWMNRETDSCTQMGGEGVTWVGEAPFTREPHIFANLGDGTYFHSGLLAIRQAVAARVNITYKVLFNDAVAMTGGQPTDGELTVADLIAQVRAEGVDRVVVVSDEPQLHRGLDVSVYHRAELDAVQQELRDTTGVSVLIYQQTCATELRRRRKRGLAQDNKPRVVINHEVCDGCGDCSVQSNCVAVEPLVTDRGVKRQVNQTACNKDLACTTGFCPAFVLVQGALAQPQTAALDLAAVQAGLPQPEFTNKNANVLISGVGGTGIVTVSALLAAAAHIQGQQVQTLDMTGLAQKGGAVFAHIRLGADAQRPMHCGSPRIPLASADTLIACDLVSAASNEALALLNDNTVAVVNTDMLPTADFVLNSQHDNQRMKRLLRVKRFTPRIQCVDAVAQVETALGDAAQANVLMLGYAFQLGGIPLTVASIEAAIRANGTAVQKNLFAFHMGRRLALRGDHAAPVRGELPSQPLDQSLPAMLESFAAQLREYDNDALAQTYLGVVHKVRQAEQALRPGSEQLTRAVAQSYLQVLAAKDEYEVARLHSSAAFKTQLQAQFAGQPQLKFLLAPPLLGARKRQFGGWMLPVFKLLARLKWLRNTVLDPFGYTADRRLELDLRREYEDMLAAMLGRLDRQNLSIAVSLAKLPLDVRGYGHVKARNFRQMRQRRQALWQQFVEPPSPVKVFTPEQHVA